MLSPDHVRARRRKDKLSLSPLKADERERALEVAADLVVATKDAVGSTYEEVQQLFREIPVGGLDRRVFDGLCKLVEDACEFDSAPEVDPVAVRREIFEQSSRVRGDAATGEHLDRNALLAEVAARHGLTVERLEAALFADLKGAQRLLSFSALPPEEWVSRWEIGQLQAALLRAVKVDLVVRCERPEAYRSLFHKLKFRRLLHRIERRKDGTYHVEVSGPFSMFESVTKYGLQLAQLVPALLECDEVKITADLRWGKERVPCTLDHVLRGEGAGAEHPLRDEVQTVLDRIEQVKSPWRARVCAEVFDLPGVGLCVPDLVFERAGREPVYLEILGYWSREAVWKRVELVERGLDQRIVFAVSNRLRVSEEVLPEDAPAALYVFKGTLSAKSVLERVDGLAALGPQRSRAEG